MQHKFALMAFRVANQDILNKFKENVQRMEYLIAESKTMPPIYGGKPGNWFKSPTDKSGMWIVLRTLIAGGKEWASFVIDHKAIPAGKSKAVEMAVRTLARARDPKDGVAWFEENKERFHLLISANAWPERSEEAGVMNIGPFQVHDTIGASDADWARATQVIEKATHALPHAGLSGFSTMAYGALYLVGQLGRKNWAAWYMPEKDAIYLRPNIKGIPVDESARHLIHELAHRYWEKKVPADKKKAWATHHLKMTFNKPPGRFPEVGETLPVLVDNKKVRVDRYEGPQAILVDVVTGAPVGKISRTKLWDWTAEHAQKMRYPSLYAATNAEEHFAESASLKAQGKLTGENLEAFNSIFG